MNKRLGVLLVLIVTLFAITSCQTEKMLKDYPNINDTRHVFEEIGVNDVVKKIEKQESFLLVMGFPECPWCQALMPVLNEVAKENKCKQIYYLYLKDVRDNENSSGHSYYLELQNNYFKDAIDDKNRINAPTFVKVEKGIMTKYHINTVESHVLNDNMVLPPLTTEQDKELRDILKEFFK